MKKMYETPKVEKMAFNYSETVVASTPTGQCVNYTLYSYSEEEYCKADENKHYWVGDNT